MYLSLFGYVKLVLSPYRWQFHIVCFPLSVSVVFNILSSL